MVEKLRMGILGPGILTNPDMGVSQNRGTLPKQVSLGCPHRTRDGYSFCEGSFWWYIKKTTATCFVKGFPASDVKVGFMIGASSLSSLSGRPFTSSIHV